MKITVAEGIQVVHEGTRHFGGSEVEVPEHLARKWIRAGWATSDEDESEVSDDEQGDSESAASADRREAQRRSGGASRARSGRR